MEKAAERPPLPAASGSNAPGTDGTVIREPKKRKRTPEGHDGGDSDSSSWVIHVPLPDVEMTARDAQSKANPFGLTAAGIAGAAGAALLGGTAWLSYRLNLARHVKDEVAKASNPQSATGAAGAEKPKLAKPPMGSFGFGIGASSSAAMTLEAAEEELKKVTGQSLAQAQVLARRAFLYSVGLSVGTFVVGGALLAWAWDLRSLPDFSRAMEVRMPVFKQGLEGAVVARVDDGLAALAGKLKQVLPAAGTADVSATDKPGQQASPEASSPLNRDFEAGLSELKEDERKQMKAVFGWLAQEFQAIDEEAEAAKRARHAAAGAGKGPANDVSPPPPAAPNPTTLR